MQNTSISRRVGNFFSDVAYCISHIIDFIDWHKEEVGSACFILFIVTLLFLSFWPIKYKGTVTERRWENEIEVKRYTFCEEDDWDLPEGATLIETKREFHHMESYTVGKTTHTRPVYRTKYYYTIYRWLNVESIITAGTDKHPYYGETDLPTTIENPVEGDLIQSTRHQRLYLTVLDKKGNYYEEPVNEYNEWVEYEIGSNIIYHESVFGHLLNKKKD